jgi:hypothetical protein
VDAGMPYGPNIAVTKLERTGHAQKRSGARLKRLVKENRGTKLHNNKTVGGKGRLTQAEIDKLQNYYCLAISKSVNNLEVINRTVWAVFFHQLLTNEKPQHGVCPSGGDNWCKFKNSATSGVAYESKYSLPAAVMDEIKPLFRYLAGLDPLKECFHGKTHSPNEHVNSVIWTRISKTVFVKLDIFKFGVYDAVTCLSDGAAKMNVLHMLGVRSG